MNDARSRLPPVTMPAVAASATVLAAQVVLPRLFSVLLWYHLAFLVVSLSMAGFALGGALVRRRVTRRGLPGGGLSAPALLAGASLAFVAALALLVRLPIDASALLDSFVDPALLLLLAAALAVPFVLLGAVVCAALDLSAAGVGRTYAATFAGGALGALLALGAMQLLGTRGGALLLALLPLAGAFPRGRGASTPEPDTATEAHTGILAMRAFSRPAPRGLLALAALCAIVLLVAPDDVLPYASRKHFPKVDPRDVLLEQSDATTEVVFYENRERHGIGAPAPNFHGTWPRSIAAAIDSWAITFLVQRSGPDDFPELLDHHPAGLAYSGTSPGFSALVLGAGGGWDVLGALHEGASHVVAVEINPFVMSAVTTRWADFAGHLYDDPRVEPHLAEGRFFVENDARLYDRIVLAGVDTFAATQAGAFALAENALYTTEALSAYLDRLTEDGVLFMTRWWFDPPRQTLRLMLTAADVLRARGVDDPARRMYVATDSADLRVGNALFLCKAHADFTADEIAALDRDARFRGMRTLYAWTLPSHPVLVEAIDAKDPAAWIEAYPYRVDPTTDDRPFFFENGRLATLFAAEFNWIHDRLGGQEVLLVTFVVLLLLCAPLFERSRVDATSSVPRSPFALVGLGYLFVELPTMQRFSLPLGHPVYAVAVVLVGLLVFSGLGALLAQRLAPRHAPRLALLAALAVAVTLLGGYELLSPTMLHGTFALRVGCALLLLAPPGIAMGGVFPLAVRATASGPGDVARAFVWNGAASVLAGPPAVMLAMDQGFGATLVVGTLCYVLAAFGLWRVLRSRASSPSV
ncbi:MAG: hypothetical protein H6825_03315 [Planctomycetes bacterium]|nr:hypothetical protein [Planctomycetota bacterium]